MNLLQKWQSLKLMYIKNVLITNHSVITSIFLEYHLMNFDKLLQQMDAKSPATVEVAGLYHEVADKDRLD